MKLVIKRISCFFLAFALIFILTFSCFNRPVKTHADVLSALALGSGALGALVCAYMATAGVQLTGGSSDADGSFLGNYVANWVKSSSSFPNNAYFNSDGEFIGSNTDLSIVQNTNTGLVSFIFGKEFAIWLEALKQSFVSEKNLTISSSTSLVDENYIMLGANRYPLYPSDAVYHSLPQSFYEFKEASISNTKFDITSSRFLMVRAGLSSGVVYSCNIGCNSNSNTSFVSRFSNSLVRNRYNYYSLVFAYDVDDGSLGCTLVYQNPSDQFDATFFKVFDKTLPAYALDNYDGESISLDGTLTDGYQDFEDAINNDLTNADEDEVAVVDVGTFPNVLDPSILVPDILDRAITGTLNPEYDGTRENTESAEEEKEGDKPFSPTVPEGWVIVNGLEDFFPFCIPWDLYNLIAELNVPPKAPKFTYKVDLDSAIDGLEYDAELDLAPFESVANVFRIIVVIGFVFFLILKTRDLIRG